jgi:hypothetical protein
MFLIRFALEFFRKPCRKTDLPQNFSGKLAAVLRQPGNFSCELAAVLRQAIRKSFCAVAKLRQQKYFSEWFAAKLRQQYYNNDQLEFPVKELSNGKLHTIDIDGCYSRIHLAETMPDFDHFGYQNRSDIHFTCSSFFSFIHQNILAFNNFSLIIIFINLPQHKQQS